MTNHRIGAGVPLASLVAGAALLAGAQMAAPLAGASAHGTHGVTAGKKTTGKKTGSHDPSTGTTVKIADVPGVGPVLVNAGGVTLYVFSKDHQSTSKCSGACATSWPPLVVSHKPVAGSGVDKSLLGTVKRGHKLQVTYGHWPLYTFAGDSAPGQAHGQGITGFGGKWTTIGVSGTAFAPTAGSGSSGSSGTTGTTGGGGGYGSGYGSGY
jgi:predicted lipoprotein with Yx(FWY)xxD motif